MHCVAVGLTYDPNASVFDELGRRLKNLPSLQIAPLIFENLYCVNCFKVNWNFS